MIRSSYGLVPNELTALFYTSMVKSCPSILHSSSLRNLDLVMLAGGGFLIPMQDFAASFWNYVRLQLKQRDLDAGFAVVTYGKQTSRLHIPR